MYERAWEWKPAFCFWNQNGSQFLPRVLVTKLQTQNIVFRKQNIIHFEPFLAFLVFNRNVLLTSLNNLLLYLSTQIPHTSLLQHKKSQGRNFLPFLSPPLFIACRIAAVKNKQYWCIWQWDQNPPSRDGTNHKALSLNWFNWIIQISACETISVNG